MSRRHIVVIPPTNENRTDIIGESNTYYYNCTKKQFIKEFGIKDSIAGANALDFYQKNTYL